MWLHSPMGKREVSRKLYHPWSGPYKVVKKLSEANYRIEQLQGRRIRKIVHFDRLKPCPKNVRINEEDQSQAQEAPAPDGSQSLESPRAPPVGQNLHVVDEDDDDYTVGNTIGDQEAETGGTTATTRSTPPCRYPRREHRAPSRYSDYVPISYVEDETSS